MSGFSGLGTIWVNATHFRQIDTLRSPTRNRTYYAKTQVSTQTLLLKLGKGKLATASPSER